MTDATLVQVVQTFCLAAVLVSCTLAVGKIFGKTSRYIAQRLSLVDSMMNTIVFQHQKQITIQVMLNSLKDSVPPELQKQLDDIIKLAKIGPKEANQDLRDSQQYKEV